MKEFLLFSGSSHYAFSKKIADYLEVKLGRIVNNFFPDREISMRFEDNVRGRDVFIVQSVAHYPNDYLMELFIMADALRRASAKSISAILPYFGYSRQDRKDKARVPITARLIADLIETAGINRVLTMDLHSGQIQGFFDIPVDNLYGRPVLCEAFMKLQLQKLIVLAPDLGAIKIARAYANQLNGEFAVMDKRRINSQEVEILSIIGDVSDKNVLLVDDMCSTGVTMIKAAASCKKAGAKKIYAAFTHGLFVQDALDNLFESPIEKIFVSDSIPLKRTVSAEKLEVVSVANIFGEAVRRLISRESISSIFY